MSSSSEEEIDELLRNRIRRQPRNFEKRRLFDVENPCEFRQKFHLPVDTFEHLLAAVGPQLEHRTRRNRALTARQQLLVFLHFLGTNSFYHVMHSCHGISTSMVWNVIDRITLAILSLQRELVCWPKQPLRIASKFHDIAGFPCVAGCVNGTHVLINPPAAADCPGRWHDSRVLKESTLWTAFEENAQRPFPGAVTLGNSAYSCNSWLIPPFRGDVEGARLRFNEAHKKTRSTIERANGVIKKRFYTLQTGLRVRSMERAAELIKCAAILHNICILFNDDGADLLDDEDLEIDEGESAEQDEGQEDRRQELLAHFL
ncbi:putative nuclease HARBI1 [Pocillopora verrucosa]|uniref:putative nuclease HARBI1 n=1 Tax=Pocillopora verrucosa TaxID=203993 RepID=UPI00333F5385